LLKATSRTFNVTEEPDNGRSHSAYFFLITNAVLL